MKNLKAYILTVLVIMLAAGCSDAQEDKNTVYLKKDGTVTGTIIEDFSQSYYDSAELENLIKTNTEEYNKDSEKVKFNKLEVKNDTARLVMNYDTAQDYSDFNEVVLFSGSISDAKNGGYEFDYDFAGVEEGNTVSSDTVKSLTQLNVVIFEENIEVKLDKKILYLSSNAELVDNKTARFAGEPDGLAYIVYE